MVLPQSYFHFPHLLIDKCDQKYLKKRQQADLHLLAGLCFRLPNVEKLGMIQIVHQVEKNGKKLALGTSSSVQTVKPFKRQQQLPSNGAAAAKDHRRASMIRTFPKHTKHNS